MSVYHTCGKTPLSQTQPNEDIQGTSPRQTRAALGRRDRGRGTGGAPPEWGVLFSGRPDVGPRAICLARDCSKKQRERIEFMAIRVHVSPKLFCASASPCAALTRRSATASSLVCAEAGSTTGQAQNKPHVFFAGFSPIPSDHSWSLGNRPQGGAVAMRILVAFGLVITLGIPTVAAAQEGGILAAAEQLAESAQLQTDSNGGGSRRSAARVGIGLAIAGAGVAMLLIDPKQPTQPTQPAAVGVGVIAGVAGTVATIGTAGWRLHGGPIQPFVPFKERNPALKYGGAALAIAGVAIAAFWSDVPVVQSVAVAPTVGGFQVGSSFGF